MLNDYTSRDQIIAGIRTLLTQAQERLQAAGWDPTKQQALQTRAMSLNERVLYLKGEIGTDAAADLLSGITPTEEELEKLLDEHKVPTVRQQYHWPAFVRDNFVVGIHSVRQTGKTCAIAELAEDGDWVFCKSKSHAEAFSEQYVKPSGKKVRILTSDDLSLIRRVLGIAHIGVLTVNYPKHIWIDDFSYQPLKITQLYKILADRMPVPPFIIQVG